MQLTHAEEFHLYLTDRAAWIRYAAPRWAALLQRADKAEKRRLWTLASPELQDAIRALATDKARSPE